MVGDGTEWKTMAKESGHVDHAAVDWSDPDMKFVLTVKHEKDGQLLVSDDGGKSFREGGKGFGFGWIFDNKTAVIAEVKSKEKPGGNLLRTTDGGKTFQAGGEARHQDIAEVARRGAVLAHGRGRSIARRTRAKSGKSSAT